jgi:hypothetical protein
VVLVHGMGRTRASMASLSESLEEAGYETVNFGYPSRRLTVAESGAPPNQGSRAADAVAPWLTWLSPRCRS